MAKKQDEAAVESLENEGASRVYELGFHLDPELPTEEVKKAYQDVRSGIENRAAIIAEGEPQQMQLAYTISRQETSGRRDFDSAYFCWIAYEASTDAHEAIITDAGANKRIVRFIDLVTTKDAARHAAELRAVAEQHRRDEEAGDPEGATADAALDAAIESAAA